MSQLVVSVAHQDNDSPAGVLTHEHPHFSFAYSTRDPDHAVSMRMPLRATPWVSMTLPKAFTMNLPEGWLRHEIEARLVREGLVDDMALLRATGLNQVGRLRYSAPGQAPGNAAAGVSLSQLQKSGRSPELFMSLLETYFSAGVSGVQPKVLIPSGWPQTKGTFVQPGFIVKAAGPKQPNIARNEFLCMEAARLAGIQVPEFWLSDDDVLFITKRFDRTESGHAIGFEDMSVLLNAGYDPIGHYKYQGSYEQIAKVLTRVSRDPAEDRLRLFEYVALSVLVRNGDAHLKNFGVLYDSPVRVETMRLAPLYDVVSTIIGLESPPSGVRFITSDRTMALTLRGSKAYPSREQLLSFARDDCGVSDPERVLDRLASGVEQSMALHRGRLPPMFGRQLQRLWRKGLDGIARQSLTVSAQRPSLADYHARQLEKARNNYAYFLAAFWASCPELDLIRQAHGLPSESQGVADVESLESVWHTDHPAHESLLDVINTSPAARDMAGKLARARKSLAMRLEKQPAVVAADEPSPQA